MGLGKPTIRQASKATAFGWMASPPMISFLCEAWFVITAPIVASLPVPDVVGITNNGAASSGPLPMPAHLVISPSLYFLNAMTFAQSMDEPPPTARIAVAPDSFRMRAPSSTCPYVGSGSTLSYQVSVTPSRLRPATASSAKPRSLSALSVTTRIEVCPSSTIRSQRRAQLALPTNAI